MRLILIFSIVICIVSGEYVPGTPGGEWTLDELLIVRAKVWSLLREGFAKNAYKKINWSERPIKDLNPEWMNKGFQHFPAKLLRLSFHDCVRYTDGSGGCDGCLNWKGMQKRFPVTNTPTFEYKEADIKEGTNNGLEFTVAILERLYSDKTFPPRAVELSKSLRSSGKSRADLWAYAAKVAIEYSIEVNNYHCENKPPEDEWSGSYIGGSKDCNRYLDEPGCKLQLPREIKFESGRIDCVPENLDEPFKASEEEAHPNPEGNGDETIDFFKSQFDFTAKESVAILGSHTLGRMDVTTSLFKYTWTSRGGHMFNNAYYRNFVNTHDWFIESEDGDTCEKIGDADGNLPDTKWVPTMNGFTKSGGPMHWIKFHFTCPNCNYRQLRQMTGNLAREFDKCCPGKPENKMCKPDHATRNDVDDIQGCERYRFAFGLDEMAVNAEIGLYFQFDQINGIPVNCSGFENFTMARWKENTNRYRRAWNHGCGLNMRKEPANAQPVSSYFETYAKDQSQWVKDYVPTFEKMVRNGYDDLTRAPDSWTNVRCLTTAKGNKFECTKN